MGEKNKEDVWVDASEDWDGYERSYWKVDNCPMACECSYQSWRNARAWSYIGPTQVMLYVKNHLLNSSLHNVTEDEVDERLESVVPTEYKEEFKEREQYRKQVLQANSKETAAPKPRPPTSPPPSLRRRSRSRHRSRSRPSAHSLSPRRRVNSPIARKGKGKGKNKDKGNDLILDQLDSINSKVRRMNDELANMREAQRESGAASSSGATQIVGSKQVVGPVDAMLQLKKKLGASGNVV